MSELVVGSIAGLAANSYVVSVASGSKLVQPGMIVAVKDVLKTDTFSSSVSAGANVAVTDLSITHEVADPANKLIITAFFGVAAHSLQFGKVGIAVHDGSSLIGVGDAAGSRTQVTAGGQISGSADIANVTMPSITFVHSPGSGSKTYTVRAINIHNATYTLYVNRTENDLNDQRLPRGASGLIIQEVAG